MVYRYTPIYFVGFLQEENTRQDNDIIDSVLSVSKPVKQVGTLVSNSKEIVHEQTVAVHDQSRIKNKSSKATQGEKSTEPEMLPEDPSMLEVASDLDNNEMEMDATPSKVSQGVMIPKEDIVIVKQDSSSKVVIHLRKRNDSLEVSPPPKKVS